LYFNYLNFTPNPNTSGDTEVKERAYFLRKSIWPLREVISGLERRVSPLIKETTVIYLRDVYDHTIQAIDTVETFRSGICFREYLMFTHPA
jgi:magnesium transporter